jgi:autotransporter strand-loop-strand O-heptosyltransferase
VCLSIEPLSEYLDNLPNKPNVSKVKAALSAENGEIEIYHIPLEEIYNNSLPFWVRGCNSVNGPHNFTRNKIGSDLYDRIVRIDKVPKISWKKLIEDYNVGTINYLKIDTEGHEHIILKEYFELCKENPSLYAKKIKFEYNETSNKEVLEEIISSLDNYKITYFEEDIVLDLKTCLYYKGVKIADRGFLINLPHRTDRLESSTKLLDELGFTGYEIFEGVVIDDLEHKKLGCTASYLKMFEEFLSSTDEDVLVFEDDIKLLGGTTSKDLDNIFSDWSSIKNQYDIVALGTKLLPRSEIILSGNTHGSFEEMLCTQSFYYKRNIIKHIQEQLSGFLTPEHYLYKCTIDMFLNDCSCEKYRFIHSFRHKKFNFGITIPMIFSQTNSYSDNEGQNQNYENEMEKSFYNALKQEKGYVLYATENYINIVTECAKSIREFSSLPIFVYLINSDKKIEVENTKTINWSCDIGNINDNLYITSNDNFYIDRGNSTIYKILIQKPLITKHVLSNFVKTVCFVDSDSVATPEVDKIFSYYDKSSKYPYFVEGIYDYLKINGRGGGGGFGGGLTNTLEHPACQLFNVDQSVRVRYRQTGYFVCGQDTYDFLDDWYWMCIHPKVINNTEIFAPFNEETIMNVLLWKHNYQSGLPYLYVNGTLETVKKMYREVVYKGPNEANHLGDWLRAPQDKEHIMFFHGEKKPDVMRKMVEEIKYYNKKLLKILFLAPHLSTGGMPAFLLKRIQSLQKYSDSIEIFVVEYSNISDHYVVQKNLIKDIVPKSNFWTLESNKTELLDIIKRNKIDIVHIDDVIEEIDIYNPIPEELIHGLYSEDRTWRIVETCHNVSFIPDLSKSLHPEAYAFCTPYHEKVTFKNLPSYGETILFPIENKKVSEEEKLEAKRKLGFGKDKIHVLNVGLWTSGKNQGEGVELAKLLRKSNPEIMFHFVGNQAPNFKEYWSPIMKNIPLNVKVWGESSDIDTFMKASDVFMFNSTWECNPLVLREAASYGLKILSRNLPQYMDMFSPYITEINDNLNLTKDKLLELINSEVKYKIEDGGFEDFGDKNFNFYENVKTLEIKKQKIYDLNLKITQHYINNPFLEIKGKIDSKFKVQFEDDSGVIHYENTIPINCWVKLNRQYFTKWTARVLKDNELIYESTLNLENKRVYIALDSKSLGDTIAWVPYLLEFYKKHKCELIVSTFWNKLFENVYPELSFVQPGIPVHNIFAMYKLGWFNNLDMQPVEPKLIPLQKTASDILGLDFEEIRPIINYEIGPKPYEGKYITIATNSTAGCKFWTRDGWQELINYLTSLGYKVVNVSKEENPFENQIRLSDLSIESTINAIHHSEFLIGLSSGLSWLAWGIGKHVVMISNFTTPDHEFQSNCTRIINQSVCNGCWNKLEYVFDKGDWNWCPVHKGTDRQFECHKSITSQMVIDKIQNLLK